MNDILIVDDDIELCELIKRRGMQENIFADYCLSGKSALHKLHEKEINVESRVEHGSSFILKFPRLK